MEAKQNSSGPFKTAKRIACVLLMSTLFLACSKNDSPTAKLQVRLTDAPGDYQEVNIDIQSIEVNSESGTQASGWKVLTVKKGVYNLLKLTNGLDTLLSSDQVPAGRISQIRLILGTNNTIKVGGVVSPLATPSAQQSGLKLNVQAELTSGIIYIIKLDFDAARSIVLNSSGYSLKPVIRIITSATSGAIKGSISPLDATPAVYAIIGADTLGTTYPDISGKFLISGLPQGAYVVSFNPKTGYLPLQKESVNVSVGQVTDLGAVVILQ